jgi:hypothetical protein
MDRSFDSASGAYALRTHCTISIQHTCQDLKNAPLNNASSWTTAPPSARTRVMQLQPIARKLVCTDREDSYTFPRTCMHAARASNVLIIIRKIKYKN